MAEKFVVNYMGSSYDRRTNKWSVICNKCKHVHQPKTTMMRFQRVECESRKCTESELIDWNTELDLYESKINRTFDKNN